MEKTIFVLSGGFQRIQQNIDNGSFSPIEIKEVQTTFDTGIATGGHAFTNVWDISIFRIVEVAKDYFDNQYDFCLSDLGDSTMLDFNLEF